MKTFIPNLFLLSLFFLSGCSSARKFDSALWIKGDFVERGRMAEDLRDSGLLLGKSKEEIIRLLGKPDNEETTWIGYRVKTIPRCGFWQCRLEVHFDNKSSKVRAVEISD